MSKLLGDDMYTKKYNVYGIGNALVDVQYRVTPDFLTRLGIDKGVMTLIGEARRKALIDALQEYPAERASGGSAANTMIGTANFGGRACYACTVGKDEDGDFYLQDLADVGVESNPSHRGDGPTGQCLVLITPDADRTMNTFLGVSAEIGAKQVDERFMQQSDYFYIEGYLLSSNNGFEAALAGQRYAKTLGTRVALTLSDPFIVNTFGKRVRNLMENGIDLLFCNEVEALAYTGCSHIDEAHKQLARDVPLFAVTCGSEGALIGEAGNVFKAPGYKVNAVDTNGAGDMFAGAFIFGITHGYDLKQSATLATYASSRIVTQYGPRLRESLKDRIPAILS